MGWWDCFDNAESGLAVDFSFFGGLKFVLRMKRLLELVTIMSVGNAAL